MVGSTRRTSMARGAAALVILGASTTLGVTIAPSSAAAATVPAGGCWTYVPSATALDSLPASDISVSRQAWSASGQGGVSLTTSGSSAVGSVRQVQIGIADGPVMSTSTALSVTATAVLSLDGGAAVSVTHADPIVLEGGEQLDGVTIRGDLPAITKAGRHEVRLVGLYFDDAAANVRMACNGQVVGLPSPGKNPATKPVATALTSTYAAVKGPVVTVPKVADQEVTTAGRPSDVISLELEGFTPGGTALVSHCVTATAECSQIGGAALSSDGSASTTLMVPGALAGGVGTLQVESGAEQASVPFTVLGAQTMVATEKITNAKTTTITLAGSGWDPRRQVQIQGHLGASGSSSPSDDKTVGLRPDDTGAFSATYAVRDADTVSLVAEQVRTSSRIGSIYLTSGVVGSGEVPAATPSGGTDTETGTDTGSGSGSGTGTTTTTTTSSGTPVSGAPVTSPTPTAPAPTAPGGGAAAPTAGAITISDIRLDGQNGIGDLFGGAPQRTLVFLVENTGTTAVPAPMIRVAVGDSKKVKPMPVALTMTDLPVGGRAIVSVPVELPPAALGTYHVVVQVGEDASGAFDLEWSSYPWGLLTLDAIGLALLIAGLGGWLVERELARRAAPVPTLVAGEGDAIVDLDAAERWWSMRPVNSRSRAS